MTLTELVEKSRRELLLRVKRKPIRGGSRNFNRLKELELLGLVERRRVTVGVRSFVNHKSGLPAQAPIVQLRWFLTEADLEWLETTGEDRAA